MAKQLDQIIVIDIEATCWEGERPAGEEGEIIEIGVCPVRLVDGERLGKESILVRPARSRVGAFCTALTGLTQEKVERGMAFAEACSLLGAKYLTGERAWASYGDYDREQFQKQCLSAGVPYPFGPGHVNVKTLCAIAKGLTREVGMAEALRMLDLPLEGVHHRAGDDAWNIAAILARQLSAFRGAVKGG